MSCLSPQPKYKHFWHDYANICWNLMFGLLNVIWINVRHTIHAAEETSKSNVVAGE